MKGGIGAWAARTVGDTFKGYLAIILIVFLVAGAGSAASVATTIAVAGGNVLGIGVGNLSTFGQSVVHGQGLVKSETKDTDKPAGDAGGSLTKSKGK